MNILTAILASPSGKPSTMRAMSAAIVLSVMATWSFVSIAKRELQPMSETHVAVLAIAVGGKALQHSKERGAPTT